MKKIFTLIAVFASSFAIAQNVHLYESSSTTVPQVVYDFYLAPNTPPFNYEFDIFNSSANSEQFRVKKIELTIDPGAVAYFCTGSFCYGPATYTSGIVAIPGGGTLPNGVGTYGLTTDFDPGPGIGTSTVRYTAYDSNNPNDSSSVLINYHVTAVGINSLNTANMEFSNVYPNPISSTAFVKYDLKGISTAASIKIYNALGSFVKEIKIENQEGKALIDVTDLNQGVYFYTLFVNSKKVTTRKLIVSK